MSDLVPIVGQGSQESELDDHVERTYYDWLVEWVEEVSKMEFFDREGSPCIPGV